MTELMIIQVLDWISYIDQILCPVFVSLMETSNARITASQGSTILTGKTDVS